MDILPTPIRTARASRWLATRDANIDRLERALLANVDGHRNVIELESFARAIGLAPDVLERLRVQGLIQP
jgi:hypothetical protein